jgi:hypothetical protein
MTDTRSDKVGSVGFSCQGCGEPMPSFAMNGAIPAGFTGCPKCHGCSWVGTFMTGGSPGTRIAEPCQKHGCRFDVAQALLDRAKERGELSEEERASVVRSAGTSINIQGKAGDANDVGSMIAAGITRAAAATDRLITINNIERFHAGEERLEPDPDGPWVRFSDAAAISNRLASTPRSATERTPLPQNFDPEKDVALRRGEYAQLVYDARRYEWLRDNMRRMPMGQSGQRHFFDQPGTMSFQEAVDEAMKATHNPSDSRANDAG